jgi:malate synthase
MTQPVAHGSIRIAEPLYALVRDQIAPGTGVSAETVWSVREQVVTTLGPRNRKLLE